MPTDALSGPPTARIRQSAEKWPDSLNLPVWWPTFWPGNRGQYLPRVASGVHRRDFV